MRGNSVDKGRRTAMSAIGATLLGAAVPRAQAQGSDYPNQAIRFIVPLAPGGVADIMSRMVAEHLATRWGQPVVVDNRPGAGTSIGIGMIAKARPDGYTIGMGNVAGNAIYPALHWDAPPYDALKDFAPISIVGIAPSLLVVNAEKIPARTIPEFIAYLKANPGKVSYGSAGAGSSLHIGMELFKLRTGTSMVHIPYKGSAPMMTDLLSGQIQVALDALATSGPHIQSGKLRALGVTTAQRVFFAPDLPSISEFVPGFETNAWHGVLAPAGTPDAIVSKLSTEIQVFLKMPATQQRLKDRGVVPVGSDAATFRKLITQDLEQYRTVVQKAGIKAD